MNSKILLSVGCNSNHTEQINNVKEYLSEMFPDITFSDAIINPAYGKPADAPPYSNMLARFSTRLTEPQLKQELKNIEVRMGDTIQLRREGIIMMDLDILQFNSVRRHLQDWNRDYIKHLLKILPVLLLCLVITSASAISTLAAERRYAGTDRPNDSETLGMAVDYFQGGKYHEAILAFEKLKRHYTLNPRYLAYLGMSYYKEQAYEEAVENLSIGIPELKAFSPKEQAVYIYCCAESLFQLGKYMESLNYYDMILPLVDGNDKGDVLFHTAFTHYILNGSEQISPDSAQIVSDLLTQASILYEANRKTASELQIARLKQAKNMLRGLKTTK